MPQDKGRASKLPVREMVLYKHGVGFFRREGEFSGEEITLTFRHDEINDVLKSLAAFDQQGGQVLGIHYQTPRDKAARLADSAIRLSDANSLFDLLRDLRGREVTLILIENQVRGRLIGVDIATGEEADLGDSLVSISAADDGVIKVFKIKQVQGVQIHDDRAQHDLHFFLDTSMSEDIRRTVTVRLSAGSHHLVAYYVAPTPTWRVSYRVVAESEEDAASGEALVQGWGLFDNRLDEDLEDVSVTLVAGQPISFIYDLYASRIPQRPVIQDEARVAPGPVEYRAERPKRRSAAMADREMAEDVAFMRGAAAPAMTMAGAPAPAPMMDMAAMQSAAPPAAEGREAGEFFQYVVTTPVSVKRGDSALVPILGANVKYTKELLYNQSKLPEHPVAAIRFENGTGLTLERGPVTLVENGEYKGEAVIDFTKAGNDVYLPYAVELGVRIVENHQWSTDMAGLNFREGYLIVKEWKTQTVTYTLENNTSEDKTVTIEAPIVAEQSLYETREPDAATATERRWRVDAPAGEITEFVRRERRLIYRHEEIRRLDYRRLQQYMEGQWVDQDIYDQLSEILDRLGEIQKAHEEKFQLEAERKVIYERQGQLRENLNALKPGGEEGQLRTRMLRQLETTENRLEAIDTRLTALDQQIADAEARIDALIAALNPTD